MALTGVHGQNYLVVQENMSEPLQDGSDVLDRTTVVTQYAFR